MYDIYQYRSQDIKITKIIAEIRLVPQKKSAQRIRQAKWCYYATGRPKKSLHLFNCMHDDQLRSH